MEGRDEQYRASYFCSSLLGAGFLFVNTRRCYMMDVHKNIAITISALAFFTLLFLLLAHTALGQPQRSNDFQFVGFSTGTIDGVQGMIAMHAKCQEDFGASARMCTGEEFWLSPNATAPAAIAWVHSVGFIGLSQGRSSCNGWTSTGDNGQGVTTSGKPSGLLCDVARPVTCCAPLR